MSSRRTLILVGAIVLGLLAALLLFNYVNGIEDRANNNAKRVDVYVAKTDIPRGTPGETASADGEVGTSKIPQEFRPATAITTTDEIQKKVALAGRNSCGILATPTAPSADAVSPGVPRGMSVLAT